MSEAVVDKPQIVATPETSQVQEYNQLPEYDALPTTVGEGSSDPPGDSKATTGVDEDGEELCLTFRAVIVGLLIGCLVGAMNVNFGLRTGWTQGGCIFSALVSIGIFKIIRPTLPFTKSEAAIVTTTASAVGSMASAAGLVSSIPALKLLGHTYTIWEMFLWAISIAFFGVYFAVPMRHQMIEVEKLRFPSGSVTAETIKTMFAEGAETVKKAQVLTIVAILTGVFALLAFFIPYIQQPPFPAVLARWGWFIYLNPLLIGGGMLSGPRASSSLLLGAIIGWAILGPIVHYNQWTKGAIMHFDGVRGWILWIGVAIMTADSLITLIFSLRMIFSGLMSVCRSIIVAVTGIKLEKDENEHKQDASKQIPLWWWTGGLVVSTILVTIVGQFYFSIQFYFVWISIPLSALLSIIAARCCGETDINPVGGMGKVTQLVFAGLAPGQITTNLLSAGISGAGASQCGDMMQDLKTGYLLNVAPRKQFLVQCLGIIVGTLVCIPIYKLFDTAYKIGGDDIPAPAAHAWKAVALILAEGIDKLPLHTPWGMLCGALVGIFLACLYKFVHTSFGENYSCYIPSALAMGIGFIIPPKQAMSMFAGAMILTVWRMVHPATANVYYFTISSGMVAGEGLIGVFIALLKLVGVKPLFTIPPVV